MNISKVLVALALGETMIGSADTDPYSGYVRLVGEDASANQSWNAKGHWSDNAAPISTKNYYVPAGALLWQQSGNSSTISQRTWNGGRLVIGGTFLTTVNNSAANGPLINDLVLLGGSDCRVGCFSFLGAVDNVMGTVMVEGTLDNPAMISHHHTNSSNGTRAYGIYGEFEGAADSAVVLTRPYKNYKNEDMDYGWSCDIGQEPFAAYPGTVIMRGGNFKARPYPNQNSYNMPLVTLRIEDDANCHFYRSATIVPSAAQIGALESAGGKLCFNYLIANGTTNVYPVVNVSRRLSLDADTVVSLPTNVNNFLVGVTPDNAYGSTFRIAHLTGTAAETVGDLSAVKVGVDGNAQLGYPVKLHAIANGDGTKDVYLATPNVAIMTNQNGTASTAAGAFDAGSGWMWTNQEEPAADSSMTYLARTVLTLHANANYPNATLSTASSLWSVGGTHYTFKTINLGHGNGIRSWNTVDQNRTYTAQRLNVLAQSSKIEVSGNVSATIDADVYGNGNLEIGNYDNGYGSVHLTHVNTNFHGRLTIRQLPLNGTLTPYKFSTQLAGSRNWGGAFDDLANAYRAITLKDFPYVRVYGDVAFSGSDRGILVQSGVRFNVTDGKTLMFGNQITYAGVLEKNGAGILELAGTARFLDGQSDTAPVAGTNELKIVAGALKISSKTAADGLAISFAEGTKLIILSDTESGYCNVKWDAPLSIETVDGKLPVEIDPVGVAGNENVTVPICTFSETAAANIPLDAFSVSMDVKGMRLKSFVKRSNGDATVSYIATFGPVGFRVEVR